MATSATTQPDLQYVLDRIAIEDCLHRYCHAVDRCDIELLRTVYWDDAEDDHIFWIGSGKEFPDFSIPVLKSRDQTLHSITNTIIRIDGDEARVESHFRAYERLRRKDGKPNDLTMYGRYVDLLTKRNGEWRIFRRKCVMDYWRIWEDSCDWERGVFGKKFQPGQRGDADPSAKLFGDRLMTRRW
jgi:hypothetical protein